MGDTRRIKTEKPEFTLETVVDLLKKGNFSTDLHPESKEGIGVKDYDGFCHLVKTLNEQVETRTFPEPGIPRVKVYFYREGYTVYSFQSHDRGIPSR
jgi:hypothetical protein